jgi:hypothetical protein
MSQAIAKAENPLDPALFRAEAISEETRRFNEAIVKLLTPMPDWWVVGAQATRDARAGRRHVSVGGEIAEGAHHHH